jgi:hypothetical protein
MFCAALLGRLTMWVYKKWRNRKQKAADIEAPNETTITQESSSLSDQSSSGVVKQTPQPSEIITKELPSLSDQSSSSVLQHTSKPSASQT